MSIRTLQEKNCAIRVLLIEDNKGDTLLIKRAFVQSEVPHDMVIVRTAEDGLSVLRGDADTSQFDVILLDLNLPGISGHQMLQILKADDRLRRIPVFVLSSSRAENDVIGCYESYANCYIVKPYDLDALCEVARRIGQFWFSLAVLPDFSPRSYIV